MKQVGGPSQRSGTGRGTLEEVQDGSRDPPGGPGRVGGPSGKSWKEQGIPGMFVTGQRTLGEVGDRWGDTRGGLGRVGGPSERSGSGRGTHGEDRDGLGDPRKGP